MIALGMKERCRPQIVSVPHRMIKDGLRNIHGSRERERQGRVIQRIGGVGALSTHIVQKCRAIALV